MSRDWEGIVINVLFFGIIVVLILAIVGLSALLGGVNGLTKEQAQDRFEELSDTGEVTILEHTMLNYEVEFALRVDGKPAYGECSKSIFTGRVLCWYTLLEETPITSAK